MLDKLQQWGFIVINTLYDFAWFEQWKMTQKMIVFDQKKSLANKIHTKGTVIGDCIIDDGESERHGLHEQASTCQFVQQQ